MSIIVCSSCTSYIDTDYIETKIINGEDYCYECYSKINSKLRKEYINAEAKYQLEQAIHTIGMQESIDILKRIADEKSIGLVVYINKTRCKNENN